MTLEGDCLALSETWIHQAGDPSVLAAWRPCLEQAQSAEAWAAGLAGGCEGFALLCKGDAVYPDSFSLSLQGSGDQTSDTGRNVG